MKQLFITDLDGTFLTPQGVVSDESARIISQLSSRGVPITVATARTPATVEPLLSHTLTNLPAIVLTGAALWDRKSHQYLNTHFFPHRLAVSAWRCCLDHGIRPFIYMLGNDSTTLHTYFCGFPTPMEQEFINARTGSPFKQIHVTDRPVTPDSRTMLMFAIGSQSTITAAASELRAMGCAVSAYPDTYTTNNFFIEIFAPGVSKASAVTQLKNMLGAEKVTVFGDNLNDLPMMHAADTAVAVANALPEVRQQADVVIGPNTDNSVAHYILEQTRQHIKAF
ncbi:cof-like hydrolase [Bacteroides sp. CAG:927]|jgi:HAD-superfamily cof-like hydrolase|nr:cof-like hydrolase [Bacteroides sp. CAG:927]